MTIQTRQPYDSDLILRVGSPESLSELAKSVDHLVDLGVVPLLRFRFSTRENREHLSVHRHFSL
jgi:hypothetical protein